MNVIATAKIIAVSASLRRGDRPSAVVMNDSWGAWDDADGEVGCPWSRR
jgi:hypothetical protein